VVESTIQIGSTFLVPAHIGSPGKGPLNASEVTTLWRYRNLFIIIIIIFLNPQYEVPEGKILKTKQVRPQRHLLRGERNAIIIIVCLLLYLAIQPLNASERITVLSNNATSISKQSDHTPFTMSGKQLDHDSLRNEMLLSLN